MCDYINCISIFIEILGALFLAMEFLLHPRYTILLQETDVEGTPPSEYELGRAEVEKHYKEMHEKRKLKWGFCGSILIMLGLLVQLGLSFFNH